MDIIKFNTTLKASGKDYFKIVFWNRFIRNPIELILSSCRNFACASMPALLFQLFTDSLCRMLVLPNIYFWIPVQIKC